MWIAISKNKWNNLKLWIADSCPTCSSKPIYIKSIQVVLVNQKLLELECRHSLNVLLRLFISWAFINASTLYLTGNYNQKFYLNFSSLCYLVVRWLNQLLRHTMPFTFGPFWSPSSVIGSHAALLDLSILWLLVLTSVGEVTAWHKKRKDKLWYGSPGQ